MAAPEVPIEVDPETGIWTTDGLPMLYVPRHFFVNNHNLIEQALGREDYARHLYDAGYRSAFTWCEHEAKVQGLSGIAVFHHYLRRLSQRGWGRFDGAAIDPESGCGEVILRHSCFVEQAGRDLDGKVCYMCAGWFPGALAWVAQERGRPVDLNAVETACAAEGHPHCRFLVSMKSKGGEMP